MLMFAQHKAVGSAPSFRFPPQVEEKHSACVFFCHSRLIYHDCQITRVCRTKRWQTFFPFPVPFPFRNSFVNKRRNWLFLLWSNWPIGSLSFEIEKDGKEFRERVAMAKSVFVGPSAGGNSPPPTALPLVRGSKYSCYCFFYHLLQVKTYLDNESSQAVFGSESIAQSWQLRILLKKSRNLCRFSSPEKSG